MLRRTNYGEADRILQLITPTGRRAVMARGVRKEKSKLAGGVELFAVSDVVLGKGKGDLNILTSARLVVFYKNILSSYERMEFGYEVLKQVARASEMVDEPEWYEVLDEVLAALDDLTVDIRLIRTWFYIRHSSLLGHELGLRLDVDGQKIEEGVRYVYDVAEQGLRQAEAGDVDSDSVKLLRVISVKPLHIVKQIGGIDDVIAICECVARAHAALD